MQKRKLPSITLGSLFRIQDLGASAPPAVVTFIVAAYNAERTLQRTFLSVVRQRRPQWRLLIIDDGSSDRTGEIARSFEARDGRVRLLHATRLGAAAARNVGLVASQTEWIVFLDADDTLHPDYLHHMLRAAKRNSEADAVCGRYYRLDERGTVVSVGPVKDRADPERLIRAGTPPCIHAFMCRRQRLIAVGGFDATLRTNEDWDLWLRLIAVQCRFAVAPRARAFYWQSAGSLTKDVEQVLNDRLQVSAAHGITPDVWSIAFWLAGVAVAGGADARRLAKRLQGHSRPTARQLAESFCEGASVVTTRGERGLVDAWSRFVGLNAFAHAVEAQHPELPFDVIVDEIEMAATRRSTFAGTRTLTRHTAVWCDWRTLGAAPRRLPCGVPLIVRVPLVKPRSWFTVRVQVRAPKQRLQLVRQLLTGVARHVRATMTSTVQRGLRAV